MAKIFKYSDCIYNFEIKFSNFNLVAAHPHVSKTPFYTKTSGGPAQCKDAFLPV